MNCPACHESSVAPITQQLQELPDELAQQTEQLAGRLLLTRYNGWLYVFDGVSEDLTIDSRMPEDRPGHKCASQCHFCKACGSNTSMYVLMHMAPAVALRAGVT